MDALAYKRMIRINYDLPKRLKILGMAYRDKAVDDDAFFRLRRMVFPDFPMYADSK